MAFNAISLGSGIAYYDPRALDRSPQPAEALPPPPPPLSAPAYSHVAAPVAPRPTDPDAHYQTAAPYSPLAAVHPALPSASPALPTAGPAASEGHGHAHGAPALAPLANPTPGGHGNHAPVPGAPACAYCHAAHTCVPCPTTQHQWLAPFVPRFAAFFAAFEDDQDDAGAGQNNNHVHNHGHNHNAAGNDNGHHHHGKTYTAEDLVTLQRSLAGLGPRLGAGVRSAWQKIVGGILLEIGGGWDYAAVKMWHSMYLADPTGDEDGAGGTGAGT